MKFPTRGFITPASACLVVAAVLVGCNRQPDSISRAEAADKSRPGIAETKAIAEEAYIYGFPMIAAYKALYQFNVDKTNSQYKAPFNAIWNAAQVFTPK